MKISVEVCKGSVVKSCFTAQLQGRCPDNITRNTECTDCMKVWYFLNPVSSNISKVHCFVLHHYSTCRSIEWENSFFTNQASTLPAKPIKQTVPHNDLHSHVLYEAQRKWVNYSWSNPAKLWLIKATLAQCRLNIIELILLSSVCDCIFTSGTHST